VTQAAGRRADAPGRRPNILVFMTDQQRADHLGCYGNPLLRTPHIDALARQGTRFDRFYVNAPVCMPNRAALITGRMPSVAGVRMNGVPLPREAVTYAGVLRAAGYRTALIGKAHFQVMTGARPSPVPGEPEVPRHDQASTDRRDGPLYGSEAPERWQDPDFTPETPYYGFDETQLCLEHGDAVLGAYDRWLARRAPGLHHHRHDPEARAVAPQAAPTRLGEELYPTRFIAETAADWIRDHAGGAGRDQPFLLHCSFPDPHHPYNPPGKYWSMYDPAAVTLPASFAAPLAAAPPHKRAIHEEFAEGRRTTGGSRAIAVSEDEARQAIALNFGAIAMIDDAVGMVMQALAESGLDDETIVIFLSDHGDFMGDHGLLFKGPLHYQSVIRMPVIIRAGAGLAPVCDSPCCAMDLFPTILECAGLPVPHGVQGRSLLPLMRGEEAGARALLIEEQSHRDIPGLPPPWRVRTLLSGRWRLSIYAGADWGELYDLVADPHELKNLFADPSHAARRAELMGQLAMEMTMLAPNLPLPVRMA